MTLLRNGYDVIIVARETPSQRSINYASPWAGAIYKPWPDTDPSSIFEADFAWPPYEVFKQIAKEDPSSGVRVIDAFEYFENPSEAYTSIKGRYSLSDGFRVLE